MKIIAEIGKNQITKPNDTVSSCFNQAKFLVKQARLSGAGTAKFQIHWHDEIEDRKRDPKRDEWIKKNIKLTPLKTFWIPLRRYCNEIGIKFLCTPFSLGAAKLINPLVEEWKIGSADIIDTGLLNFLKSTNKPIIMSSGMSTLEELDEAVALCNPQTILHCVSLYPCPLDKANLSMIPVLKRRYPGKLIGYSDHTLGFCAALGAIMLDIDVLEKHFTLTPNAYGPDHKVSITPEQFKEMVFQIGEWRSMLGSGVKFIYQGEEELKKIFRYENPILSN